MINDVKVYYTLSGIEIIDNEWDEAEKADEKEEYYIMHMYNGGKCIKKYKPSIAVLVSKRTGLKLEKLKKE